MDSNAFPDLELQVAWALCHEWKRGQRMRYEAVGGEIAVFWLVEAGQVALTLHQSPIILGVGDAILFSVDGPREIQALETARWGSVAFRARWLRSRDVMQALQLPQKWRPDGATFDLLRLAVAEIAQTQRGHDFAARLRCEGALRCVLGHCFQAAPASLAPQNLPLWLETALRTLREDPNCDLCELARRVGYSPGQFRARFRETMNLSPGEYARNCRTQRARELLHDTDWPVSRIAAELGFAEPTHFVRAFKAQTGLTPSRFRQHQAT